MNVPVSLIEHLQSAQRVVVLTGAGVSAESGVPTFRDAQTGLWSQFNPEELATPHAFQANPRRVWEWYDYRRQLVAQARPNPAHQAIAQMQEFFPEFHLVTQNIDDLHQRAGSRDVIQLHGNITRTKCFAEDTVIAAWEETGEVPPKCPNCGALLRPDVVWFGELMPEKETALAFELSSWCDVFFSIGTSGMVYPAAALPVQALENGATMVEINPERTPLSAEMDFVLTGAAGIVLPRLVEAVGNRASLLQRKDESH